MALPDDFRSWEHLQLTIRSVQRRIVQREFNDVGPEDWDPNIMTPRASLRVACTPDDNDTAAMTLARLWLFYGCLQKCKVFHPDIFGIPVDVYRSERRYKPQVKLHFVEDPQDVDPDYQPVTGEISFRLMTQTADTLSMSEATNYANKIRTAFANANGFVWQKGKTMCTYTDWDKGYQLQLLCRNESEGRRVIEQVLDIQSHAPDWGKMNVSQNQNPSGAFPTSPPRKTIMGKSVRLARRRPIADVRFAYAELSFDELPQPLVLVDRVNRWRNALVKV